MIKKENIFSIVVLLLIWQITSSLLGNDVLLPTPIGVLNAMITQVGDQVFYQSIGNTVLRVIYGVIISLIIAGILGLLAAQYKEIDNFFSPINLIIKTIPNITYIIIALIWLGPEKSVALIVFFILFPTFYNNFYYKTKEINEYTRDLFIIFPVDKKEMILKIYLPQLLLNAIQSIKVGFGLGFKVGIMAEILGQVKIGIGKQMNYARINLEMTDVFAWTIWVILISGLITLIIGYIEKKVEE